jgi:hypothetical protein
VKHPTERNAGRELLDKTASVLSAATPLAAENNEE